MPLSDDEKREIIEEIKASCEGACKLSPQARQEMPHIVGVVQGVGDGNYSKGAEHLRKALTLFGKIDKFSVLTVRTIYVASLIAILGSIYKIFGAGWFEIVKK